MAGNKATMTAFLNAETSQFQSKMDQVSKKLSGFGDSMKALGGIMAGAFATDRLVNFGKEASAMAGKLEGIKAAFVSLNQPALLAEMRAAVRGTVNDMELMRQAVKASEFGIPIEKMGNLMRFAAIQAQKMGESTGFMLDSLVGSMSTQSKMRLDNLGISMASMNEEMAKGKSFADAAFTLMNEKLGESTELLDTTTTRMAALGVEVENLKLKIGGLINEGLAAITPAANAAMKALSHMIDGITGNKDSAIGRNVESEMLGLADLTDTEKLAQIEKYNVELAALVAKQFALKRQVIAYSQKPWYDQTSEDSYKNADNEKEIQNIEMRIKTIQGVLKQVSAESKKTEVKPIANDVIVTVAQEAASLYTQSFYDRLEREAAALDRNAAELLTSLDKTTLLGDTAGAMADQIPGWQGMVDKANQFNETIDKTKEKIFDVGSAGAQLGLMLSQTIAQGTTDFKSLAVAAVNAALTITQAYLSMAIGAQIYSGAKKGLPGLIAAAVGVAMVTAMFNKHVKPPALAGGGLAYGPTLAMVGDNPGARTDPEVIAPLSKLQSMQPKVVIVGKLGISMGELRLAIQEANDDYYRNY